MLWCCGTVVYHCECICRHKRNLAVRDLADYRPYWFARDLRGSQEAKVVGILDARVFLEVSL